MIRSRPPSPSRSAVTPWPPLRPRLWTRSSSAHSRPRRSQGRTGAVLSPPQANRRSSHDRPGRVRMASGDGSGSLRLQQPAHVRPGGGSGGGVLQGGVVDLDLVAAVASEADVALRRYSSASTTHAPPSRAPPRRGSGHRRQVDPIEAVTKAVSKSPHRGLRRALAGLAARRRSTGPPWRVSMVLYALVGVPAERQTGECECRIRLDTIRTSVGAAQTRAAALAGAPMATARRFLSGRRRRSSRRGRRARTICVPMPTIN